MSQKKTGQVFTSENIVNLMLNLIHYNNTQILNKNIMENSCGNGAFLTTIVNRYITIGKQTGLSNEKIKYGLENHIYGIEIDANVFTECIRNLNVIAAGYDILNVKWKILNMDALLITKYNDKMDYIIGNPPYIRIHNIDRNERALIRENYSFCKKGMTDMYIAFFELGIKMLNNNGTLIYITPNSFMNNTAATIMREYIEQNNMLELIINFGCQKVFNVSTYTAITMLKKRKDNGYFNYYECTGNLKLVSRLSLNEFKQKPWNLTSRENIDFLNKVTSQTENIKKYAKVQYALTTMRDKVFISKDVKFISNICFFNGFEIEKDLVKPIIKSSTYSGSEITEYAIFPYYSDTKGYITIISEDILSKNYPKTYSYLLAHKETLISRDIDKDKTPWYAYGRSQGIQEMFKEKLSVKPLLNEDSAVKIYKIPSNVLIYAGIFITGEKLYEVKKVMESEDFHKYAMLTGKDLQGNYKTITTKMINDFKISFKNRESLLSPIFKL